MRIFTKLNSFLTSFRYTGSYTDIRGFMNNILIVEDDPTTSLLLSSYLEKEKLTSHIVDNGFDALDYIRNNSVDIVLMDCEMPVMDGFEAAQSIREFEAEYNANNIPIIAVTAHAIHDIETRCTNAGMTQHLSKPIQLDSLRQAIDQSSNPRAS